MVTTFLHFISTPKTLTHTHTHTHTHTQLHTVYLQEAISNVGYGEDCKNVGF